MYSISQQPLAIYNTFQGTAVRRRQNLDQIYDYIRLCVQERDTDKSKLRGVTLAGIPTPPTRNAENYKTHTGLFGADFDKLQESDRKLILQTLAENPHTILAHTTSGLGVRAYFEIPAFRVEEPMEDYESIKRNQASGYGKMLDFLRELFPQYPQGKTLDVPHVDNSVGDAARLFMLPYDPDVYYNPHAIPLEFPDEPVVDEPEVAQSATTTREVGDDAQALVQQHGMTQDAIGHDVGVPDWAYEYAITDRDIAQRVVLHLMGEPRERLGPYSIRYNWVSQNHNTDMQWDFPGSGRERNTNGLMVCYALGNEGATLMSFLKDWKGIEHPLYWLGYNDFIPGWNPGVDRPTYQPGVKVNVSDSLQDDFTLEQRSVRADAVRFLSDFQHEILIVREGVNLHVYHARDGVGRNTWEHNPTWIADRITLSAERWAESVRTRAETPEERECALDVYKWCWYKQSMGGQYGVNAVMQVLPSVLLRMDSENTLPPMVKVVNAESLNTHNGFVGVRNGVVDIANQQLLDDTTARSKYLTRFAPTDYDKNAVHPLVTHDKLLPMMSEEDAVWFLQFDAQTLYGMLRQKVLLQSGPESSGKTAFNNLKHAVFGTTNNGLVKILSSSAILEEKFPSRNAHNDAEVGLHDCLWGMTKEYPEHRKLDVPHVKEISGGDPFAIRQMYTPAGTPGTFRGLLIITGNTIDAASLGVTDRAMARRLVELPWRNLPEDKVVDGYERMLDSESVHKAFLAMYVRLAAEVGTKSMVVPDSMKAMLESRQAEAVGVMGQRIVDYVEITNDPNDKESYKSIFDKLTTGLEDPPQDNGYAHGYNAKGMKSLLITVLGNAFTNLLPTRKAHVPGYGTQPAIVGIRVKQYVQFDPDDDVDLAGDDSPAPSSPDTALPESVDADTMHALDETLADTMPEDIPEDEDEMKRRTEQLGLNYYAPRHGYIRGQTIRVSDYVDTPTPDTAPETPQKAPEPPLDTTPEVVDVYCVDCDNALSIAFGHASRAAYGRMLCSDCVVRIDGRR